MSNHHDLPDPDRETRVKKSEVIRRSSTPGPVGRNKRSDIPAGDVNLTLAGEAGTTISAFLVITTWRVSPCIPYAQPNERMTEPRNALYYTRYRHQRGLMSPSNHTAPRKSSADTPLQHPVQPFLLSGITYDPFLPGTHKFQNQFHTPPPPEHHRTRDYDTCTSPLPVQPIRQSTESAGRHMDTGTQAPNAA